MSPKGRPTDDPKTLNTRIRLSEEDVQRLEYCVQVTGMKKSEIIRQGIKEVYERLKNRSSPPPWKVSDYFISPGGYPSR